MAEAEDIQPGDLVQLKSGGPTMTFEGYEAFNGNMVCSYFDGKKLVREQFAKPSLRKVEDLPRPGMPISASPV
jgi:uncharacterized protein YodC (DUF2158 family)